MVVRFKRYRDWFGVVLLLMLLALLRGAIDRFLLLLGLVMGRFLGTIICLGRHIQFPFLAHGEGGYEVDIECVV